MNSKEKFDTTEKPWATPFYLRALMWLLTQVQTLPVGGKITKVRCEGLEPPYLMVQNHASFVDFAIAEKTLKYKPCNWIVSIEEFNKREWLMRSIGSAYKRKFTKDITVVKHILTALKERSVVIYPEARFSLVGKNEQLDGALGKLVKKAKVPVVTLIQHGNFLRSPQWNKRPYRNVPVEAEMTQIVTKEEALTLSAEEIDKRIKDKFLYDDYRWQLENKIKINSKYRAHNIHKALYQCPCCNKEFSMNSRFTKLWCENCNSEWEMDVYGVLKNSVDSSLDRLVPDWYDWQRDNVRKSVINGDHSFIDDVRIEHLVSSNKGFVHVGDGKCTHDERGFILKGKTFDGAEIELNRSVSSMYSCHIEYNYKNRGDAFELCTLSDTYFIYPKNHDNVLTKLHFATEELYNKLCKKTD